jgi:PAS domain S-box-containing protein
MNSVGTFDLDSEENTLKGFFDSAPMMMGVVQLEGDDIRHVADNQAAARFFGAPADQLRGKLAGELGVPRASIDLWLRHYREAERTQSPVRFEYEHVISGDARILSVSISFIGTNENGHSLCSYIVQDITDARRNENELRKSKENLEWRVGEATKQLRLVSDAIPALVSFIDKDLRYQFVNAAYDHWFGKSRFDVLGRTMREVLGEEALQKVQPSIDQALSGKQARFEADIHYKSGGFRWISGTYIPRFSHSGKVEGFAVLVNDITPSKLAEDALRSSESQIRESEERLRLALEAAKMGVYEWDLFTGNVMWSAQAKTILEYEPGKLEDNFESFLKRMHPEDRVRFQEATIRAAREARSVDIEIRYFRSDGKMSWLHAYGKGIQDSDGRVSRAVGVLQDITRQKKAEEEVEIERNKLRSLLLQAPAIFSVTSGPDHVLELFNEEARKGTGGRDCTGLPVRKALPELEGKEFFEVLDRVYATGEPIHLKEAPADLIQPDGSKRRQYFNVVYHPWRDTDGKIAGIMNVSFNVTEQVTARKKVEESERRFRSVVENMSEGLMLFDPDQNLIYQNPASLRIHSFDPEGEKINSPELPTTWEAWNEKGRKIGFDEWPVSRVFRHERFKEQLLHVRNPETGQEFYGRYNGSPIYDEFGNLILGFITIRDITEQMRIKAALHEREEEVSAFSEAMPQMAFIADSRGNIVYYNKRHYEYFGVQPGETEAWEWKERGIHHPDDFHRTLEAWKHSLKTGQPYEIEYRLRRNDGTYRWHLGRAVPHRDESGKIVRWFGTNTDIHDQKEARAALEEAIRARDEFLSVASHELKTPLASLKLQTQLFKRGIQKGDPRFYSPERINKLVDQADRQTHRLTRLVDDMLDIARIRSGKLTVEMSRFDLCELAHEVVDRMKPVMAQFGVDPELTCDTSLIGDWDRFRIEQVLANLLTNAMRYGAQKPVRIRAWRKGKTAVLSVQDRGVGIAPENQTRIFNRFERAVSSNEVSGLGLGLFITRQIVEAHSGKIWVESPGLEKGAIFYVELPLFAETQPQVGSITM